MPCSSSAFTSEASLKRGGGSVKCCSARSASRLTVSPSLHWRQHVVGVVDLGVVRAFLVHRDVAGLDERGAVGAQQVALRAVGTGAHVDRHGIEHRVAHLRGDRALPDQGVEAVEVILELALDVGGRDRRRGRADGLVGFLGILRLGLVDARLFGDLVLAVQPRRHLADLGHRLGGERHRVGAHVGDESDAALADVLPLVQLLREPHGAPRVEAELARGLLLQGGGGEGRGGVAAALLALDREHGERAGRGRLDGALDLARLRLVGEAELFDLAAAVLEQLQREVLRAVRALALDGPVFLRLEGFDFLFALADHAQCRDSARGRRTVPGALSSTAAARG